MFLYEYMTSDELEIAQENAKFENELKHIDTQLAILCLEHEARLHDIETEVLLERYSEDNLTDMYSKEMAVFTEGVKELWENFKKWIKGIVNAILGKNKIGEDDKKSDEEVDLEFDPKEAHNTAQKLVGAIKKATNFKKPDGTFDTKKLLAAIGVTAAGAGVTAGAIFGIPKIVKKCKMKKSEVAACKEELEKDLKEAEAAVESLAIIDDKHMSFVKSIAKSVVDFVSEKSTALAKAVSGAVDKAKDGVAKLADKAKDGVKKLEDNGSIIDGEYKEVFDKKDKQWAKSFLRQLAKNGGFDNPAKGNKITVDDMKKIYDELVKRRNEGKFKKVNGSDVQKVADIIKWMVDNNINECAIDDLDGVVFTESLVDSLEQVDGFEFESFLESYDDQTVDELIELVSDF